MMLCDSWYESKWVTVGPGTRDRTSSAPGSERVASGCWRIVKRKEGSHSSERPEVFRSSLIGMSSWELIMCPFQDVGGRVSSKWLNQLSRLVGRCSIFGTCAGVGKCGVWLDNNTKGVNFLLIEQVAKLIDYFKGRYLCRLQTANLNIEGCWW